MMKWKKLNSLLGADLCKGRILAARVYPDVPGFKCQCGGLFNKRVSHDDEPLVKVPRCNSCNKYPPLFHIDADIKDANGNPGRIKIRNDSDNNRLETISSVLHTLRKVQDEIKAGEFDVTRYVSKEARESFRFKNYIVEYLKFQDQKLLDGLITPKGLRDKKSLISKHILPFFSNDDLTKINRSAVGRFQKDKRFIGIERTRDLALGELRTILRQAVKDNMIKTAPEFDKIPKSKTRENIISLELIHETIALIPQKIYQDMFLLMSIYPLRPSELRALRWKDIDFENDVIRVNGHFSDEVWIDGRKSIKDGKQAKMKYDLIAITRDLLRGYRAERVAKIDKETDWVFKGIHGTHVQDEALSDSWREARKKLGHIHQLYEIRHRCLTEFGKRVNGNIVLMQRFSGHRNASTLLDRYVRDDSDMREFIK